MKRDTLSRRRILGATLLGLPAIPAMIGTAFAQATTPAKPASPAAKPAGAAAKPAAAPAKPAAAGAAALPMLGPNEPAAKALGYIEDTKKVDAKANPMHKVEQHCGNCLQWADKNAKAPISKCNLFPGKMVKNEGWCKVWVKKPGTA